ncbi:polyhomeotic-like protein 3 isoform X3 [Bos indicus]|uniref:Polyhomeotic-like protein 3 isoform X4 n=3 Tax=Bovinae TaxID=27592 RepID=A0A6P3H3D2_BISBB|nr:polyhomeotic-like protein 3 isoform X5 [Bos taurus]XP_010833527.1 PREDICTED: polyhomeotic-like protein 3 isoform X4 [Bison bison bison]XP_019815316.1 PREDICTED: polyhomeotic-like protein 3 isoform X3 [Bos indicus]XP_027397252.1 polyhomeotic-like protein 3 isoform X3 [Bos indicus x Bos taurus]XP_061272247.1 polyhomeotic-like protein 3 isoform X6 [Bos javanicus]
MAEAEFKDHSTAMDSEPNPGTSSVSTTNSSTTTTTITTSSSRMQQPQISVYSGSDRHAVQVIQQALHRPSSSAAQYLQQMYAAQQQHLMLHTAALQQQHLSSSQLQSLAAVQASLSSGRPPTSPTGSVTQQSSMSQTSLIFTPATTVAAVQSDIPVVSSSSSSSCQSAATQVQNLTLRSQKLGVLSSSQNGPPKSTSQTQSLTICHNKTTVTSSKISQRDPSPESNKKGESPSLESRSTAVTRTSSIHQLIAPASYPPIQPHPLIKHQQIPLHSPPPKVSHHQLILQQQQQQIQPITLQSPTQDPPPSQHCIPLQNHGLPPAPSSAQSQHCSPIQSHPPPLAMSPSQSQSAQQSVVVSPPPPHSPSQSPTIIIHPQALIQPHPLVSSALQPGSNLQQSTANQVQPTTQLNLSSHLPLPASPVVHIGPVQQSTLVSPGQQIVSPTSHQQYSTLQSSPIPIATPPQMSTSPPAQIPPLPLQSMQSLQVQPEILSQGQVLVQNALVSEEELPAAEALVQLPFQTLPPPQTVAVNLQVQPPAPVDPPVGMHLNQCHLHKVFSLKVYQVEDVCEEEMPEESEDCVRMDRTPPPPTLSPAAITVGRGEDLTSEHPLLEQVELPAVASVSASVIKSPSDPSHVSVPPPPLLLPAATTRSNSTSMPSSVPSVENKPPQAIVKPQILTHVIEGFVIQEGLEPFPVSRSSLLIEQPVKRRPVLDNQVINSVCVQPELQNNAKHADNSSDTEMEDMIAEETLEEMDSELLKCEFCGKMGYANEFLRSKRFCTMSCAKRYNVSCSKKFALSRWNRKPDNQSLGHRGRRPSGPDGAAREHILRQLPITYPSAEEDLASHEDAVPSAMTTRLRRQSERERERELRDVRMRKMPENSGLLPVAQTEPSIWTVDDVWAFIHSLPGCQDIADEFRAQEIDGQALLLLKEDHLMSAMNIKLGPALKICARINSLKES